MELNGFSETESWAARRATQGFFGGIAREFRIFGAQARRRHRPRRCRRGGQEPSSELQPRGRRRVSELLASQPGAPCGLAICSGLYFFLKLRSS